MKRFAWVAVSALTLAACGDRYDPTDATNPSFTIAMPGNTVECNGGVANMSDCFANVDAQFKLIYERNNTFARTGEAVYIAASNSNAELASIFTASSTTPKQALAQLDRFIGDVQTSLSKGDYGTCAANDVLTRAQWLRNK